MKKSKQEIIEHASKVKEDLKDFQLATVDRVYKQFYHNDQNRFLVADEVGLGKTIVAKGVIAKATIDALNNNKKLRVVYICSNQALTGQNLKKLNFIGDDRSVEDNSGRLIFLAKKNKEADTDFYLSSLTPSTSFNVVKGLGVREERKLIWLVLSHYQVFSSGSRKERLSLFLQGGVTDWKEWWQECRNYEIVRKDIRNGIPWEFKKAIESETIKIKKRNRYKTIYKEVGLLGEVTLKKIISKYINQKRFSKEKQYKGPKKIIGLLRKILTQICLQYLEADIFILDEFQKFKTLIETGEEGERSEAGEIANIVFGKENAKILMLSATPFKPFNTNAEIEQGDNNFEEFKTVLSFLFKNNTSKILEIEQARKLHFNVLRKPSNFTEAEQVKPKEKLEQLYREVMSRTERNLVSDDNNTLLKLRTDLAPNFTIQDLDNYLDSDQLIKALEDKRKRKMISMVEFSKSAPYPLSFLDGYKISHDLKDYENELKDEIEKSKSAWLDLEKIHNYRKIEYPNSRMRLLHQEAFKDTMELKLWLAPSCPYYKVRSKAYGEDTTNSKILVFSKWKMVPKAIATLTSYEAERRTIGKSPNAKEIKYNPQKTAGGKHGTRKPRPRLPLRKQEGRGRASSMSVFSLIYPSIYLAKIIKLQKNILTEEPLSATKLIEKLARKIQVDFNKKNLGSFSQKNGQSNRWYWATPILLDLYFHEDDQFKWLEKVNPSSSDFLKQKKNSTNKQSNQTAKLHLQELIDGLDDEKYFNLGKVPDDLFTVLAKQALASPAVCSLRLLQRYFKNEDHWKLIIKALDLGNNFISLFDKPESIAIVDFCSTSKRKQKDFYWENVLDYCLEGNLQSMLDEFGHLIYPDHPEVGSFSARITNSININTSSLKVDNADSISSKDIGQSMRCHYAVDFGNQKMEDEAGKNRIVSVLNNFNSPFRPFVLATTSVGQEGLDFHLYCRKVMHWNLPTNPVDLEQREGRVNRYKGLVVRQNIIAKYLENVYKNNLADLWDELFAYAEKAEKKDKCDLVPFWHVESNGIFIDRIVPQLPYSKEFYQYKRLIKALTYYRLTFGQPRQEELLKSLTDFADSIESKDGKDLLNRLLIDLSPMSDG